MGVRRRAATAAGLALVATTALLVGTGAPARGEQSPCPVSEACVVVHWTGSAEGTQVVTADDIDAWHDVVSTGYPIKTRPDAAPITEVVGAGLSLNQLLTRLTPPIPVDAVHFTSTVNRRGQLSTLRTADLQDPSPFVSGLLPVVYIIGSKDSIGYIRPMRDADDLNGVDAFQTDASGALELTVHLQGQLLVPVVTPSTTTTTTGKPVRFGVSFDDPPGVELRYEWDFGDGTTGVVSAHPRHRWAATGTYPVTVAVTGADGSLGQSAPVVVSVDTPDDHHGPHHPGSGHHHDPDHPATGPNDSSGHHGGGQPTDHAGPDGSGAGDPGDTGNEGTGSGGPTTQTADRAGHADSTTVTGLLLGAPASGSLEAAGPAQPLATAPSARTGQLAGGQGWMAGIGVAAALLLVSLGAMREERSVVRRGRQVTAR